VDAVAWRSGSKEFLQLNSQHFSGGILVFLVGILIGAS
jgi:hypothetical protein